MAYRFAVAAALALTVLGTTAHVSAQGLISTQKLSAALANELVGESVAACAAKGYTVTAVVVDLDGVRQALLRGNGAPIHTLDNAFYKAYSAASLTLARPVYGDRLGVELAGGVAVVPTALFQLLTDERAVVRFVLVHLAQRLPLGAVPRPVVHENDQRLRSRALGLEHAVEEVFQLAVCEVDALH